MKPRLLMRTLVLSLVAGFLIGGAAAQNEPSKPFQGIWLGGMGDAKNKTYELTFAGTKLSAKNLKDGKVMGEGTCQFDAAKKTLDVVGTTGEYKGKTYRGLYSVEGTSLKWCVGNANQPRPGKIAHEPGAGSYLLVLQKRP